MNRTDAWLSRREFARHMGLGALGLTLPAVAASAAADDDAPFAVTHGPVLQCPGAGEVAVTWHTNRPAVARVMYGPDERLEQVAFASRDGLIPNDSTCHAVRLTGLTPGQRFYYRLASQEFKGFKTPYNVNFGETLESEVYAAAALDPGKTSFSFLMWNDIHDNGARLRAMFEEVDWTDVDFVVLNGDIINDFVREKQFFSSFYDVCAERFGAALPLVFVRGNHETRGGLARRLSAYVPGRGGRPYYSFVHGGVHFLVLDTGEDKPDDNVEYAGLVDFASFREEQTRWLQHELDIAAAQGLRRRIVLSHQPLSGVGTDCFGAQEARRLWLPLINAAGAQLWLSGHTHSFVWKRPGEADNPGFHAMTNPVDAVVRVDAAPEQLRMVVVQQGGNQLHEETIAV